MVREPDILSTRAFGRSIDFGRTAADYRRFRAGFPPAFFDEVSKRGWIVPGLRALDLGTGTGTVARGLAERGLEVVGTDPSVALLEEARTLDRSAGVSVVYREGRAEAIDAPAGRFDVVTAGQCWHWFDRDKAATEVERVLAPGGRVIVAHFDWLPLPGNVVNATEQFIIDTNPSWTMAGGTGIYPQWLGDLSGVGFEALETFSFDVVQPYRHDEWRGRIRASAGVSASLDAPAIERFDAALKDIPSERFPDDPLLIPHRVWAVSGVRQ
ncbi:MAG: class I SAM-dependent methyltransferase [Hyphomicrobiales bacterium]|nr:class I SAM-dependent methyltransferase [Hyphomicrobiales bacterium]